MTQGIERIRRSGSGDTLQQKFNDTAKTPNEETSYLFPKFNQQNEENLITVNGETKDHPNANAEKKLISLKKYQPNKVTKPFSKATYKLDDANIHITRKANHSAVKIKGDNSKVKNSSMTTDIKILGNNTVLKNINGHGTTVQSNANNVTITNNSINSTFNINGSNTTINSAGSNTTINIKEGTQNTTIYVKNDDNKESVYFEQLFDNTTTINIPANDKTKVTIICICEEHQTEWPKINVIQHNICAKIIYNMLEFVKFQYEGKDFSQDDNEKLQEIYKQHVQEVTLYSQDIDGQEVKFYQKDIDDQEVKLSSQDIDDQEVKLYSQDDIIEDHFV